MSLIPSRRRWPTYLWRTDLGQEGLKQFRKRSETEKFPHVTFFFNDYRDEPFPGEDRQIVPSPKLLPNGQPLSTYDQMPEMSAYGVCDEVVKRIDSGTYDLVVVNFANGDMVGHTGVLNGRGESRGSRR